MPTLHYEEYDAYEEEKEDAVVVVPTTTTTSRSNNNHKGDTAQTLEMDWIANEFVPAAAAADENDDTLHRNRNNDSTYSESFLESALHELGHCPPRPSSTNVAAATAAGFAKVVSSVPSPPSLWKNKKKKEECENNEPTVHHHQISRTGRPFSAIQATTRAAIMDQRHSLPDERKDEDETLDEEDLQQQRHVLHQRSKPSSSSSSPSSNGKSQGHMIHPSPQGSVTQPQQRPNPPRRRRVPGPYERLYQTQYQTWVQRAILQHHQQHDSSLANYRHMTDDQKIQAQQQVRELLERLHIPQQRQPQPLGIKQPPTQIRMEESSPNMTMKTSHPTNKKSLNGPSPSYDDGNQDSSSNLSLPQTSMVLFSPEHVNKENNTMNQSASCHPINETFGNGMEESGALFSPDNGPNLPNSDQDDKETSRALDSPKLTPPSNNSHGPRRRTSHESPIEQARSCRVFQSPDLPLPSDHTTSPDGNNTNHNKRLSSTSGKRGADHRRAKWSSEHATPKQFPLEASLGRLSLSPHYFPTSQSPILPPSGSMSPVPHHGHGNNSSISLEEVSMGDNDNNSNSPKPLYSSQRNVGVDRSMHEESLETFYSKVPYGSSQFEGSRSRRLIHNVKLKQGATLHYQPLPLESHPPEPDPLSRYSKPIRTTLYQIYKQIKSLHNNSNNNNTKQRQPQPGSSIVFSLPPDQAIQLCMKLVFQMEQGNTTQTTSGAKPCGGQTLIVVREKPWIEAFGQAFREGSSLPVVDHSTLPLKERKSLATTERLIRYSVVLTTFEALKSNDTTLPVNAEGSLVLPRTKNHHHKNQHSSSPGGEWHSSRNGGSQATASTSTQESHRSCSVRQCSILHCLSWRRVIFFDTLGRRSFLVKPDTSRFLASASLETPSRLVFFPQDDHDDEHRDTGLDRLLKSDKKAVSAMCRLLQLDHTETSRSSSSPAARLTDVAIDAEDLT